MWLPAALSQEDIKELKPEALAPQTRPAAFFMHDAHNEKAGIDDCTACHHGKDKDGKMDPEDNSAGTACVDCHAVNARTGTPLKRAYHQQCISCHEQKNQGPTYCGGCHKG
ncbi:cytochrome c family protein [Desulfovibrio sp. OttesenSCG-928-A18]|nr:cytochrome c family protein [Desulfovibrio sp. OttesenSCG-928-A18]